MKLITGMSLLELMIAMAILAILLGVSMPGYKQLLDQREGDLTLRKLADSIMLARSIAAKTGQFVSLCPSQYDLLCEGDWNDGYLVFNDADRNRKIENEDQILLRVDHTGLRGSIQWRAFQKAKTLQISPLGFIAGQSGNFTYCPEDRNPANAAQLVINQTGRVRLAVDKDRDGFREDSQGKPLSC
ncbi:MAG: GspH/FimT family pseudopilin [Pseudohongiellaceae bacterium]